MPRKSKNTVHQTEHFNLGFIFEPSGHLKASAKAGKFISGTLARYRFGEWPSVMISSFCSSGRVLSHQP